MEMTFNQQAFNEAVETEVLRRLKDIENDKKNAKAFKDTGAVLSNWIKFERETGFASNDISARARLQAQKAVEKFSKPESYKNLLSVRAIKDPQRRQLVMDSFDNYFTTTNLYKDYDSVVHSRFMGYSFLSMLAQDALINNGITVLADELTRKWGRVISIAQDGKAKNLASLEMSINNLKTQDVFREAAIYSGYFGGALIYIDIVDKNGAEPDDAELETPLFKENADEFNQSKLKQWRIRGLKAIEPINISPSEFNSTDPTKEHFYKPSHWYILGKRMHASRFLYLSENVPPMILKPIYMFFGIPLAQLAFDYVQDFYSNKTAINKIVKKFSLLAFKTDTQKLLDMQGTNGVADRVSTIAKYRDNDSMVILDMNEESLEQINTPINGLQDIWKANLELIPMIFKVPAAKLLQSSPGGMSSLGSSGNFEMRSFYDAINTKQNLLFGEPIKRLIEILCIQNGFDKHNYKWNWTPLFELSEAEIAELNDKKANTSRTLYDIGAISNIDIAKALISDENSGWTNISVPDDEKYADDDDGTNGGGFGEFGGELEGENKQKPKKKRLQDVSHETKDAQLLLFDSDDWKENDHPRKENGQFGEGGGKGSNQEGSDKDDNKGKGDDMTSSAEKEKKIKSVHIDFDKDNVLPELNKEDAKKVGVPTDKKILFKVETIKRNETEHGDIKREEYNEMIGEVLYSSDLILPNKETGSPNYYHFIKYKPKDHSLVLLDCEERKENLEIVHLFKMKTKKLEKLKGKIRKGSGEDAHP